MNALLLFLVLLCAGCSADYMREHETPGTKNGVITDIHRWCSENPKDSACDGQAIDESEQEPTDFGGRLHRYRAQQANGWRSRQAQ